MPDCFDPEKRSWVMAQIKSEGTKPEERLAGLLSRYLSGFLIIRNPHDMPGKPDFYIPNLYLTVFVDGCFFHGCPQHCRFPQTNAEYWQAKIKRNRQRDKQVTQELKSKGYRVLRIWEHELRTDKMLGKDRIRRRIRRIQKLPQLLDHAAETRAAYVINR